MSRKLVVPVTVVLILGLLMSGALVRSKLLAERRAAGLEGSEVSNLPPLGAASILLLGGFRGIAVDVLWLKALTEHEKRHYVEERSLIELITQLEPHFLSVWAFQSLVIAYDISVQEPEPADQWRWIEDAVDFMKKGIALNPDSRELYFYLAYIYQDKVSQNPYFEDTMERDLHQNNFEEAAKYYERCRTLKVGQDFPFHPRVCDVSAFHCLLQRSQQIMRRSRLTAELQFTPETLAQVQVFADRCAAEIPGLRERWPKDAVIDTFPARIALLTFDGYVGQIQNVLADGNWSEASIATVNRLVAKALAELDRYRSQYPDKESQGMMFNKTVDALTRMPTVVMKHVGELINKPDIGIEELRGAVKLLRSGEDALQRISPPYNQTREVASLKAYLPSYRKAIEGHIEEISK